MAGDPAPENGEDRNSCAASWPQHGDIRRVPYQPLVIVLLAVGGGMVADRYLSPVALDSCIACWLVGAATLIAWFWAWRTNHNRAAGWLVIASAALAGGAWHHLNW